jgi:hypothetical protein
MPFIFRCPNTGSEVQGFVVEEPLGDDDAYEPVTCLSCGQTHLVNFKTGKIAGEDSDK